MQKIYNKNPLKLNFPKDHHCQYYYFFEQEAAKLVKNKTNTILIPFSQINSDFDLLIFQFHKESLSLYE